MKRFYFDYAAATPVDPRVVKAMEPYSQKIYGNPSSLHEEGRLAKQALEESRQIVAGLLNVSARNIIFTGGGTEADNLAIFAATGHCPKKGKVIISAIEHKAILYPVKYLQRQGWEVEICPVDERGLINEDVLLKLVDERTVLISIIYANNEIGVVQDIPRLVKLVKKKNPAVYFHTDAAQAVNYLEIDVTKLGVDLLSFSASKIYGPKGVGVLYINGNIMSGPMIWGGGQERGMRSGTENVAGIVGLAVALKISQRIKSSENDRLLFLRNKIISRIVKEIPEAILNGDLKKRLPNNISFSFAGAEGESLVLYLDNLGLAVSTGSACSASDLNPSHVLLALGQSKALAHGSLRFTMGRWTSEESVERLLQVLPEVVEKVRMMSATYKINN